MTEARLSLSGIAKAYAAPVLGGIDLQLRPGEVHALLGENGAGKSTLSKIACGIATADAGTMRLDGAAWAPASRRHAARRGVRIVTQELTVIPTLTIAENLFLADLPRRGPLGIVDRRRLGEAAARLLALVGLGARPDTLCAELGVGQQQLVEIAGALTGACRVLFLDEPTAALTDAETEALFAQIRRLRADGATVVYISHRLDEVRRIADRVSILRDGALVATADAAAVTTDEMVALMVGRQVTLGRPETRRAPAADAPVAIEVQGLCAGAAVRDVAFVARRGEILGFAGLMGAGRTETMRAVFGADRRDAGEVFVHGTRVPEGSPRAAVARGLAFVTEDRKSEGLLLPRPLRENVTLGALRTVAARLGVVVPAAERALASTWIDALGIRAAGLEQPVAELSGGNQQKALIARWLACDPSVLLFDEPTRGIDVGARAEIYRLLWRLADDGKTILVVSSDLRELMLLSDRIVVLSCGRVAATLERRDFSEEAILGAALSGHRSTSTAPARAVS